MKYKGPAVGVKGTVFPASYNANNPSDGYMQWRVYINCRIESEEVASLGREISDNDLVKYAIEKEKKYLELLSFFGTDIHIIDEARDEADVKLLRHPSIYVIAANIIVIVAIVAAVLIARNF